MAYGRCRSQRHEEGFFLACNITSSKACYSSFSLSYHWFLLINQIPPSSEISCLCINCNIFFLNLINDWDPVGVLFFIFLFWHCVALGHTSAVFLLTHFLSRGFWVHVCVKFGFSLPLLPHPDLENSGNAGIPILFSCLWDVVGWDMWHGSMWLVFHVKLSYWVTGIKDNLV